MTERAPYSESFKAALAAAEVRIDALRRVELAKKFAQVAQDIRDVDAEEAEREERERPGLYEASDARYDWKDAT